MTPESLGQEKDTPSSLLDYFNLCVAEGLKRKDTDEFRKEKKRLENFKPEKAEKIAAFKVGLKALLKEEQRRTRRS